MLARRLIIILTLLVGLAIVMAGCYTVIRHPSAMQSEEDSEADYHSGQTDCLSCHQDYHEYPYGYYYGYYPDYYWDYPRWGTYYAYPWWWDHYWYDNSDHSPGVGEDSVGVIEKPERRRGLLPPYSRGDFTMPPPAVSTGSTSSGVTNPGTPGTGSDSSGQTIQDKKEVKKEEDKKPVRRRKN